MRNSEESPQFWMVGDFKGTPVFNDVFNYYIHAKEARDALNHDFKPQTCICGVRTTRKKDGSLKLHEVVITDMKMKNEAIDFNAIKVKVINRFNHHIREMNKKGVPANESSLESKLFSISENQS